MKKFVHVVAAGSLVLGLGACSVGSSTKAKASSVSAGASSAASSSGSSASSSTSSTTSSASSSPSSSPSSSSSSSASSDGSGAAATTPDGTVLATAAKSKMSFAVPKGWVVVSDATAKDPKTTQALTALAQRQHTTADKLVAQYTSMADVIIIDAGSGSRFADNINSSPTASTSLPSREAMDSGLKMIHATPEKFEKVKTPLGEAETESYSLVTKVVTVHGVSIAVPNGASGFSTITVSTTDQAKAAQYTKDILASLRKS